MALSEVLVDELRDMYSAENQLIVSLPKLAKGAKDERLKQLFTAHLAETKGQVQRLKKVFEILDEKPTGEHCNGMEGVIEEGADALEKDEEGASFDSGIVGAALQTEHYEIAGYTATVAMAKILSMLSRNIASSKLASSRTSIVRNLLAPVSESLCTLLRHIYARRYGKNLTSSLWC